MPRTLCSACSSVVELEVPLLDGMVTRLLEFVVLVDCLGRDDEGRDVQGYPVSEAVAELFEMLVYPALTLV
jgi:hypothetical protein